MILSNYHTHTLYCDGRSTVEEHVKRALELGFHSLGFSGHGYVPYTGVYYGMTPDVAVKYRNDVKIAKIHYAGRLNIFLGLENDSVNLQSTDGYDYTIGSVHNIKCGGRYYSVDSHADTVARAIAREFGGDGLAYAQAYYDAVYDFTSVKRADILGHIDLVRRFNEGGGPFFDENSGQYRSCAGRALEMAVRSGYYIEVSTAPIFKQISDETYPANFLLRLAKELGARVIVNSDAHRAQYLGFAFDKAEAALRAAGFAERWELTPDGFAPVEL